MVGKARDTASLPMPDEWRRAMLERMAALGMTQAALAKRLGVAPANVLRMLKPQAEGGYHNSVHAMRAGEIVGVPLPVPVDETIEAAQDLLRRLLALSPIAYASQMEELRRSVDEIERAVTRTRNKPPR